MKLSTELQKLQQAVGSDIVSVDTIPNPRILVEKVQFENGSYAFSVQHIKNSTLELIWDQWDSNLGVEEDIIPILDTVCKPTNKLVDLLVNRTVEYLIQGSSVYNRDTIEIGLSLGDCLNSLFGSDTLFIQDKIGWIGDINIDLKPYFKKYYSHTHGVLALCTSYEDFIQLYLKTLGLRIQPSNIDSLLQDINNINNGRTSNTATQEQIDKVLVLLESESNIEQGLLLVETLMDTAMVQAMNGSRIVSKLLRIQDIVDEIESFNFMWDILVIDLMDVLAPEIPYNKNPVLSWESYNTLTSKPHMMETVNCDWSNLPQELYDNTLKQVNGGRLPRYTIVKDYYVIKGKRGSMSSSHKVALQYMLGKNLPKDVERYVEEGKEQGMDEGKAWAIAWSRYCKYKNPNSDHCKQDEYLPNQGKKQANRVANTFEIQRLLQSGVDIYIDQAYLMNSQSPNPLSDTEMVKLANMDPSKKGWGQNGPNWILLEMFPNADQWKTHKILDLRSMGLKELPSTITNFTNLDKLLLGDNNLNVLPDEIGMLTSLKGLLLSGNNLSTLPNSIGNLKGLQQLFIIDNNLTKLPNSIGNLSGLQELDLSSNSLVSIPDSIGDLKSLKVLDLTNNNLKSLPDSIGNLSSLVHLALSSNDLTDLPSSIGKLKKLKQLFLHYNDNLSGDALDALPISILGVTRW